MLNFPELLPEHQKYTVKNNPINNENENSINDCFIINKKHCRENLTKYKEYNEEKMKRKIKKINIPISTKCSSQNDERNQAKTNEESSITKINSKVNKNEVKYEGESNPMNRNHQNIHKFSNFSIKIKLAKKLEEKESKVIIPKRSLSDRIKVDSFKEGNQKNIKKNTCFKHRWGYGKKDYYYYGNGKNKHVSKKQFLIRIPLYGKL